jgi:hypothetical protein
MYWHGILVTTAAVSVGVLAFPILADAGTAFTYQGELTEGDEPASGLYDFEFSLWDAEIDGSQVGLTQVHNGVSVSNGLFTLQLDFGAEALDNSERWLQIDVDGIPLEPRQPITRTPYAIQTRGITVNEQGYVGIGTTEPEYDLHIAGVDGLTGLQIGNDMHFSQNDFQFGPTTLELWSTNDKEARFVLYGNSSNATMDLILWDGKLGIGTDEPQRPLHLAEQQPVLILQDGDDTGYNQEGWLSFQDSNGSETAWFGFADDAELYIKNKTSNIIMAPNGAFAVENAPAVFENHGDQAVLVSLYSDRSWSFIQQGTGSGTALKLKSVAGGGNKDFIIQTGGSVHYANIDGEPRVEITTNTVDAGYIITSGPGGSRNVALGSIYPDYGAVQVYDDNSEIKAAMYVDTGGDGHIFADIKNFRVTNPRDPRTDICYACVEGPEAAAYVRGTAELVNGAAVVTLPTHFADVAVGEGMTVQLTPRSAQSRGLAVVDQSTEHFDVRELFDGRGTYEFHWEVKAVRQGHENFEVIRPRLERDAAGIDSALDTLILGLDATSAEKGTQ